MDKKILQFEINSERYIKLAKKRAEERDFFGALGFLYSALKNQRNVSILKEIASVYFKMEHYELSNRYLYEYLAKAPKNKVLGVYKDIAVNYFYLDELFLSGYYFNKIVEEGGYINADLVDDEIVEYFSQTKSNKQSYYVAYPFDKADYSYIADRAKKALAHGNFSIAEKMYSSIPKECLSEGVSGEYAITCLLNKKDKKVIEICNDSLIKDGENVTAYCNLSTLFHNKKDSEQSSYYYKKALECRKGEREEWYRIATCAIEQEDHETAKECLREIVGEREYDYIMRFFYGISFVNLGDYENAEKQLSSVYRTCPEDIVFKYYASLVKRLKEGDETAIKLLPLKYVKDLPKKVTDSYKKELKKIYNSALSGDKVSVKNLREIAEWCFISGETENAKKALFSLAIFYPVHFEEIIKNNLIRSDLLDEVKCANLYTLLANGYRDKVSVLVNKFMIKFKPKKVFSEKDLSANKYTAGYVLCLTKAVFSGLTDYDKIAFVSNKLYTKYRNVLDGDDIDVAEVSAIILLKCNFKFVDLEKVCKMFGAEINIVKQILEKIGD